MMEAKLQVLITLCSERFFKIVALESRGVHSRSKHACEVQVLKRRSIKPSNGDPQTRVGLKSAQATRDATDLGLL